jgi:O-antigen ligase
MMATLAPIIPLRRELETPGPTRWLRVPLEFLLLAVPLVLVGAFLPAPVSLLVAMIAIGAVAWKAPVRGVYFLVAAVVIVESFPLGYPDSLTDRIPLFQNLSNVGLPGIAMSPLEALMIEIALIAFLRRRTGEREARLPGGPIAKAYVAFMAVVLIAELHGLLTGGDFKLSLWELRPQVYGFVMFLLAGSLVRTRRQMLVLGVVLLCAIVFKAVLGTFRWQFILNHTVDQETLLGHEDSYFLVLFILALLAAVVWARRRTVLTPLLVVTPLVAICLLANQRRVGLFALVAAVLVMAAMLLRLEPGVRKQVVVLIAVAAVAVGIFVGANWNKSYGLSAQLVRPVRSLIDPSASARDDSSDLYRAAEDYNLKFTFKENPLVGLGFGMPFHTVASMVDISNYYPLWNVIPHNTMLWLPMRMGIPGMIVFWGLIGMAVLEAFAVMRRYRDPAARAVAAFAVAAIIAELMVGYGDLQLESYRNLAFLGALLGVLATLPRLPEVAESGPAGPGR